MDRTILHCDCNSFYASVELLYHPKLRNTPVAVGGDQEARHGIVLAANSIAKKQGVKTGMVLWQAKQLCPGIVFLPARLDLYIRFSKMVKAIFAEYTDLQESFGLDESWLDVSGTVGLFGSGREIAEIIRQRIKAELGITVSIGVSWNKIFAKLGSDYKKPDAVTEITRQNWQEIVFPLPASDLLYVGRATQAKLTSKGIFTIGELAGLPENILVSWLGKWGSILYCFSNGLDASQVSNESAEIPVKSIGNSSTTPRDLTCNQDAKIMLYVLAESVAARLRENGCAASIVEISVRDTELSSFTRQCKIETPTNLCSEIAETAYALFMKHYHWNKPVRSIGVRGSGLVLDETPQQLSLMLDAVKRKKLENIESAVDSLRNRFGYHSIKRGLLYTDAELSALDAKGSNTVHPIGYF